MVTVTGFQKRNPQMGNPYYVLELQSDDLELIISQKTGKHYATVRKCTMSCTFEEHVCKMMIGKTLPGTIQKEVCEPYTFVAEETGEEITLSYRNVYSPIESQNTERVILGEKNLQMA